MKRILYSFILMLAATASALAGGILSVDGKAGSYLFPSRIEATTTIQNQVAITVTRQHFTNTTGAAAKLHFFFPTGVNAVVTQFRWWQHGELRVAQITGAPQDTAALGSGSGGGGGDARLLRYLGSAPFIFPFRDSLAADSGMVVELTYMELLRYGGGRVNYMFPANMAAFNPPAAEMQLTLSLESDRDIISMTPKSHPETNVNKAARSAHATLSSASFALTGDVEISYELAQKELGVSMLSIKPNGEDGYFLMLAEPDPTTSQNEIIDKTFTFIIDISGSMTGRKLDEAKRAASYTISHLNPEDRFNVIAFSSDARKFREQPIPASLENVQQGLSFINALNATGGTNLELPLLLGLGQQLPDTTANIIVFLTDGIASLNQEAIQQANTRSTRIFVFGIGTDVNQSLLTQLAANNSGLAEFLGTDDVETRVSSFYNKIRNPLLQNTQITFSAGDVYEVYPLPLPDIYVGEQLVMLGRYRNPGPAIATLRGEAFGKPQEYTYPVTFTDDSLTNVFIPKMWAKYKMDALLVFMKKVQEGSNQWKEWRDEIIRLSKRYGILSPFSSFSDPGSGGGNGGGGGVPSAVEEEMPGTGAYDVTVRAYPNPFTSLLQITFTAPEAGGLSDAAVTIYDVNGRAVAVLLNGTVAGGDHTVAWDGRDMQGRLLPAGTYICRVSVGGRTTVRHLVLVR